MADGSATSNPHAADRNQRVRALYQRERDNLFRVALRVSGGRRSFAEDVVHDVFVQLIDRYDSLDDSRDLGGWLYRCAMNASFTRLRREAVRASPLVALFLGAAHAESPSADVNARLDACQREALDALSSLPPKERIAFVMVRIDEQPLAAVATVLACSVSQACKLAQRAEDILEKRGWRCSSSSASAHKPSSRPISVARAVVTHTPAFGVPHA